MSSEFADSFTQPGDDSVPAESGGSPTRPFDDDDYLGYDSFSAAQYADSDSLKDSAAADSPLFRGSAAEDVFSVAQSNDQGFDGPFGGGSEGPILPPPAEMEREEGFALREWRRENAIRLAEKEQREKDLLNQIIDEADEYKLEFYQKRKIACENNKAANREKEKVFLANQEKFHAEANKTYWKAIADLIPNEVPTIEKKRGKKDQDKKPSIVVIQGPKPGKPTDLSRMRQILLKLKHSTPDHLKHAPPAPPPAAAAAPADAKTTATPAAAAAAQAKAKAVAVA